MITESKIMWKENLKNKFGLLQVDKRKKLMLEINKVIIFDS